MDFWTVVENRRSTRRMSDAPVEEELVKRLITAASLAPSSGNSQPWKFYAAFDAGTRRRLAMATFYGNNFSKGRPQDWLAEAPVLITVCHDLLRSREKYDRIGELFWGPQDCAAAIENLLLAATALGLATCWIGGFRTKDVSELLDLDASLIPVAIVAVGHPRQGTSVAKPSRRGLDEIYVRV